MEFSGFMPPEDFWAMNDRLEEEVRRGADSLPLFRLDAWNGKLMLGSWQMDGSEGGVLHGNAFATDPRHPVQLLEVITTTHDPVQGVLNRWHGIAEPPRSLTELQSQDSAFQGLGTRQILVSVDGVPAGFELWMGPDYWFAAGRSKGFGVVIEARGRHLEAGPLNLRRVSDVEPLLHARRAAMRELRGEA